MHATPHRPDPRVIASHLRAAGKLHAIAFICLLELALDFAAGERRSVSFVQLETRQGGGVSQGT